MDKTTFLGIIAIALLAAGCVSQQAGSATPTPSLGPSSSVVSVIPDATPLPYLNDSELSATSSQVNGAIAEIDSTADGLADLNSQNINESALDVAGG